MKKTALQVIEERNAVVNATVNLAYLTAKKLMHRTGSIDKKCVRIWTDPETMMLATAQFVNATMQTVFVYTDETDTELVQSVAAHKRITFEKLMSGEDCHPVLREILANNNILVIAPECYPVNSMAAFSQAMASISARQKISPFAIVDIGVNDVTHELRDLLAMGDYVWIGEDSE